MQLGESIRLALDTIRAHKLRSFLTLLGVIIGVTAVIGMMSVIRGLQLELERQMSILQPSVFQVQKWPMVARMGPGQHHREPRPNIVVEYADAIRERCPAVSLVGPEVWQFGVSARRGEKTTRPSYTMAGGTPEFFPNNGYYVGEGRAVTYSDDHHNRMVAVIGTDLVEDLFPHEDPLGKEVKIIFRPFRFFFDAEGGGDQSFVYSHKFTVVGVLEHRGSMMGDNKDDRIIIPFSTFEKIYGKGRSINITIQARQPELFAEAQDQVIALMRGLRGLRPGDPDNFALYSSEMGIQTFNAMTGSIKYAAVGICAISLLVAGIGIMNIMLVSVNERTREIGVRKALGARPRDILGQFVVEAIVLSEIGGVIGVGVGLALGLTLGATIPALRAAVPIWAVFLGLGFCSLVGLFFGIYPASRAAKLDPIVALHYE